MFRLLVTALLFSQVFCAIFREIDTKLNFSNESKRRVINGFSAQLGQFQAIASLRTANAHIGGGALIHPNWVLTAASITLPISRPADLIIVLGVTTTGTVATPGISVAATEIKRHQAFLISNAKGIPENNIAAVRIGTISCANARFGVISSIFMDPLNIDDVAGSIIAGWGSSAYLSFVRTVPFTGVCETETGIFSGALCARSIMCNSDVGSPLISGSGLIGIASSTPCDATSTRPDVYMRISTYRMWILTTTGV